MTHSKKWIQRFLIAALTALLALTTVQADETITYIHWDALGSPVAATDEAGNVVWREAYRPYGERINNEVAAGPHSRWYTGHPQDADTGLVYAGARYYDPVVGRFLAIDPVGVKEDNLHSFNRYAYGANNPYKYVDPDGRSNVCVGNFGGPCGGGLGSDPGDRWGGVPRAPVSVGGSRSGTVSGAKGSNGIQTPKDLYSRPSGFRNGKRDKVWESAKESATGQVRDSGSGRFMNKNKPWDMGHKPGHEFRKHQKSARERGISRKQFLDEHNNPSNYRPELPSYNRSHRGEDKTDLFFGPSGS